MGTHDTNSVMLMQRDLHDGPLQDVFATMLRLDTIASSVPAHIAEELRTLSALQRRIIGSMREICHDPRGCVETMSNRDALTSAIKNAAIALGFVPMHTISPVVDEVDDRHVVRDVVLSLRECLSNVARHARATAVDVDISIDQSEIRLRVVDDGIGLSTTAALGNGLANLRSRAESNGGSCTFTVPPSGGTIVDWTVPLTRRPAQYGSTGGPDGSSCRRRSAAL